MKYAEVIVDINHHQVDKSFDYQVPIEFYQQVMVGKRVLVPFNNRKLVGFIVGLKNESDILQAKAIIEILDDIPVVPADLIELSKWIPSQYFCQQIQILKSFLPGKVKRFKKNTEKHVALVMNSAEGQLSKNRAPVQYAIINFLKEHAEPVSLTAIKSALGEVSASLRALEAKGLIVISEEIADKNPYALKKFEQRNFLTLTNEQESTLTEIIGAIDRKNFASFLLHGVTGSGKTEIYMQAIAKIISHHKEAIVLVPEISLTPQTVTRFKERFGGQVAVFHSRLTEGEKMDQWWKIITGQVKVVIGARSAVFAPFNNLGLIVIDEEHENTYKQEETPKYNARDVAVKRAQLTNSIVICGSATPALESYHNALLGEPQLLKLTSRPTGNQLPAVKVVDLREELRQGNRSIFSRVLHQSILDKIAKREQVILFLNRRGHSTFVSCRQCGYVAKCPNCSVSLTMHADINLLKCHYCDYSIGNHQKCPSCNSEHIRHFGIGTQKVEDEVKRIFPHARVLRMDVDTTKKKGSHEKILTLFQQGRADILIGTQMIAKGLDFPRVSLVGILAADLSLNMPDFRACERTFQLLAQVAGRAGRATIPGKVI
ncbi:MAG: primosomal protein N', partial [Bacillota bacterium]|nr:primosomal protein N' [Bacillota bacterium]